MPDFKTISPDNFETTDGLVGVYKCVDGTWRVSYYPFADKDRNLAKDEAFALAKERHAAASKMYREQRAQ